MYDYVDGKVDWMAFGLPVEGEDGPFAGSGLSEAARCGPDEGSGEVANRMADGGHEQAVVVNEHDVVLGLVERPALERSPDQVVAAVMTLSPSTVRPSVLLSSLADADAPVLVTNAEGVLMGVVQPRGSSDSASGSPDDEEAEMQALQGTFLDVAHAVEEHFAEEDPSEDEVLAFLHERLVAEGRTPEEADAYLAEMNRAAE